MEENRNEEMENVETTELEPTEHYDESGDEKKSGLGLGAIIGGAVVLGGVTAYKAVSNKIKAHKEGKDTKPKKKKRKFHVGFVEVPEEADDVFDVPEEDIEVIEPESEN